MVANQVESNTEVATETFQKVLANKPESSQDQKGFDDLLQLFEEASKAISPTSPRKNI